MMQENTFKKLNTSVAALVFIIAATVYCLTVEPTASLWDCPEFIACGYKLEIGHPPGAPFYMLLANLFSQLASNPSQVALMVNILSALLSAGCIFFLFLTITILARKLICPIGNALPLPSVITIEGCGVVGALAYTFSDTFWFSAVEAEVYAFSSFLTALMFWLILKWEERADDRWIILIAYITGLSIGVHLLCLLCLPALLLVAYYRKAKLRLSKLALPCILVFLIGFSSYGVILIRANAHPPMCENEPANVKRLSSYLSREQYGQTPLYPRIYSQRHAKAYEDWLGEMDTQDGIPTKAENLRFFFSYQVNFMYWRYFLWNFVGRQNNIQGYGEVEHGNWITGFRWIDDLLLGCDTSKLPSDLKNNKGRNVFYALPLLLGLMGMLWQWRRGSEGKRQFLLIMLLFVMTGLAIVVYLNQTPQQPRERDYAYVGSFYAFAIWIGLGVASLRHHLFSRLDTLVPPHLRTPVPPKDSSPSGGRLGGCLSIANALLCLAVPLQMASQTWDDHDRSGRYTCRDFGQNYLMTLQDEGHPIILTNGDNDTFPLWYNQEVEGVRTDVRDCNMEYLQTDWYIDQMKRPAYLSPALPISFSHEEYKEGEMEYVPIDFDSITIGETAISLKGTQGLFKNELMVLDMLSQAKWQRPIYLSISMGSSILPFLQDHLVLEGLAYRVSPTAHGQQVDTERLYDNIMHRFRYGGLNAKGIYVDEDVKHMANTHQWMMGVLIDSLLQQGDLHRAIAVCHKWQREMPQENVPYTDSALSMARCYYLAGQTRQGDEIACNLLQRANEWLTWITTIHPSRRAGSLYTRYTWLKTMKLALTTAEHYNRDTIIHQYYQQYEQHFKHYESDTHHD